MLGKAAVTESSADVFPMGQGEKLVRCLFETANELAPAVIFVDEIDSILTQVHRASIR